MNRIEKVRALMLYIGLKSQEVEGAVEKLCDSGHGIAKQASDTKWSRSYTEKRD